MPIVNYDARPLRDRQRAFLVVSSLVSDILLSFTRLARTNGGDTRETCKIRRPTWPRREAVLRISRDAPVPINSAHPPKQPNAAFHSLNPHTKNKQARKKKPIGTHSIRINGFSIIQNSMGAQSAKREFPQLSDSFWPIKFQKITFRQSNDSGTIIGLSAESGVFFSERINGRTKKSP